MASIEIGTVIKGFAHGTFGRDSYGDKRVEAIGADWIVVREEGRPPFGGPWLYRGTREQLAESTVDCDCKECLHLYGTPHDESDCYVCRNGAE